MDTADQRGDLYAPDCPARGVLDHLTSRWGVLVLVALLGGTHRFSELSRKISGVSDKMLAQTLKTLERDGFITRTAHLEVPVRVSYSVTAQGTDVARLIANLTDWIQEHIDEIEHAHRDHDSA